VPDEWYYHTLRFLHPLGALLGFAAALGALLSIMGDCQHVVAGRWFVGGVGAA
jgi:hypothetical protein